MHGSVELNLSITQRSCALYSKDT